MNEILEQTLLYDFYGELLNEHQKEIYEQFILEDLSLGEIAKEAGISRQAVHDLIRRCGQALKGYEEKLHLVAKFMSVKDKVNEINELLNDYESKGRYKLQDRYESKDGHELKRGYEQESMEELVESIRRISDEIIEEL